LAGLSKIVWLVALAKLALHLAFSTRGYGFFGDEFYYIACAQHLDFGYVDHPPLSIWLLSAWQSVLGDSLAALRALPALFGAAAVVLTGLLARELGGRASAQVLCAVVVALAPVNGVVHGFYSMNAVDIVVWGVAFVVVARVLRHQSLAGWIALGCVLGFGMLNKLSVSWFGLGLLVGLIATPYRRVLKSPGPWIAAGLAVALFLPHVLWQIANGWPTAEFVAAATAGKMVSVSPLELLAQQALVWNPLTLPLWVVGAVALLRRPKDDVGRVFVILFATTAAILIVNGTSRPNYLALAMPPLIAGGAIAFERAAQRRRMRWLLPTATVSISVVGLALAPLSVPILAVPNLIAYADALHFSAPKMENREVGALDPHFADMLGWEEIVDAVAEVYASLPPEERARAAILAPSYSVAGAIDRLGPERGLPGAISGHNNYWLWGPGDTDGAVVVIAGGAIEDWAPHWQTIEHRAVWDCGDCLPGRNHANVYVARGPRAPLAEIWAEFRHYR
jgi:hypothetical protein